MTFIALSSGTASISSFAPDTYASVSQATPDDVFVITFNDGGQLQLMGFDDAFGFNDFEIGRPTGVSYVNFTMYDANAGGTFTLATMDGTPLYTFVHGSGALRGGFRFHLDTGNNTLTVYRDINDDVYGIQSSGNYDPGYGSFDEGTPLYNGPACFLSGTLIATPAGQAPVESLRIGDRVLTSTGQDVAVKWIGRREMAPEFAARASAMPVCIRAGALGDGLPRRDLYVSGDHALLMDGLLVHASALINGRGIKRIKLDARFTYWHIETEAHETLLAEGVPAETFIDLAARNRFDNAAEFAVLYPDAAPMQEMALPRVKFARQLPQAIARRLLHAEGEAPFPRATAA